jgi:hypothetical protein
MQATRCSYGCTSNTHICASFVGQHQSQQQHTPVEQAHTTWHHPHQKSLRVPGPHPIPTHTRTCSTAGRSATASMTLRHHASHTALHTPVSTATYEHILVKPHLHTKGSSATASITLHLQTIHPSHTVCQCTASFLTCCRPYLQHRGQQRQGQHDPPPGQPHSAAQPNVPCSLQNYCKPHLNRRRCEGAWFFNVSHTPSLTLDYELNTVCSTHHA